MCGNIQAVADIVPVDISVKLMITIAWDTAVNRWVLGAQFTKLVASSSLL